MDRVEPVTVAILCLRPSFEPGSPARTNADSGSCAGKVAHGPADRGEQYSSQDIVTMAYDVASLSRVG